MIQLTKIEVVKSLFVASLVAILLCGCGGSPSTTPAASNSPTVTIGAITLSASPTSVKSDNSVTSTITVTTISATNTAIASVPVSLSTDTGLLSTNTLTTDSTGKGTFTFSVGSLSQANRTATITATVGTVSQTYPIQIVGSTATISPSTGTVPDNGTSPVTVTVTAKDASGTGVPNTGVLLTQSGAGVLAFSTASGVTNTNGIFTSTVTGATAGAATLTATTLGATATTSFTISPAGATFGISSTTLNGGTPTANPTTVAMQIGDSLVVTVNAPGATGPIRFVSTMGTWTGGTNYKDVAVASGTASATLTTTQAGIANISVYDKANTTSSASLTVSMTASTPYKITLQANPTVLLKSVGTTTGVSTLLATVTDSSGNPVGNAPVAFTIVNPTGGGETVSPAIVFTAATPTSSLGLGQASASFTSGSISSTQSGVLISASVPGTAIQTGILPSGADASVVIGGTAGSISWGQATVLQVSADLTSYIQAMSVVVADSNGNPAPAGTVVNLSLWPIAWSTGAACTISGTYYNEDINENLFLDPGEDGYRKVYPTGTILAGGSVDGLLTPPISVAGTVPGTLTTDAHGLASFNLTYGKNSGIWIVDRIRASTVVQGSATTSQYIFRLPALNSDVTPCILPDSPYKF